MADKCEDNSPGTSNALPKDSEIVVIDSELQVNADSDVEKSSGPSGSESLSGISQALFQNQGENGDESDGASGDDDSGTDHVNCTVTRTQLQRCEHQGVNSTLPDTFQTNNLLFYERFKAFQDYMLGDCKPSEVKAFTTDYLEKVMEPCDWLALWCTDGFDVLVEVQDVDFKDLKACVALVLPMQCETRGCELTQDAMKSLLEATRQKVPLLELRVVYELSGEFDQTALALEHLRFFYTHIWRQWDEEDEDDDFDYFVRCVEPRLRLFYDMLEDRVPTGLVAEYRSLLEDCSQCFQHFAALRSSLSADSDSELDNVSMVEGLKLCEQLERFKRKLHIIENPLLRYVLGYKGNARQQCVQSRGPRASGVKVVHVVTASCSTGQLQSLLTDRLLQVSSSADTEIQLLSATLAVPLNNPTLLISAQFHRDPISAVESYHQDDMVIILPGVYSVSSNMVLPDSITIEGFGFPDDVVIEKKNKGDSFVESTGVDVKLRNIKFIQHDAIEGILCVRQGTLTMENCVLQCETTGVIVRTAAHFTMNMCDLYGSKGAGVEIYPGSVCRLVGNGIHHCKDGVLIKDFADDLDVMPSITLENNIIHNNEGYGVILVRPSSAEYSSPQEAGEVTVQSSEGSRTPVQPNGEKPDGSESGAPAASARKWQFTTQLSRNKETTCSRVDDNLTEHQIFASIQGNQFKRNGSGNFGTFFY